MAFLEIYFILCIVIAIAFVVWNESIGDEGSVGAAIVVAVFVSIALPILAIVWIYDVITKD